MAPLNNGACHAPLQQSICPALVGRAERHCCVRQILAIHHAKYWPYRCQQFDAKSARKSAEFAFPSLRDEKRTHVGTACAAHWLGRKQQTLRGWACFEGGPIRPARINGRLAWSVDEIRRLLNVGGKQ